MIDYEGLRALDAVIRHQSFGKAARELFITQSAVSQRLKELEASTGQPLLVRELPYHATPLGEQMLAHLRQVTLLEQSFESEIKAAGESRPQVKIAVNRDSLELWFTGVLEDKELAKSVSLAIITDDEKYTLRHLKSGRVDLCVSSIKDPLQNYESHRLGGMAYMLVASPDFKALHFPGGMKQASISAAPAVLFDEKDDLHHSYLREKLGFEGPFPFNSIPSVRGYSTAIMTGYGYGMLPEILIERDLESGKLVKLKPTPIVRELYLHHWNYQSPIMKRVIAAIQKAAKELR